MHRRGSASFGIERQVEDLAPPGRGLRDTVGMIRRQPMILHQTQRLGLAVELPMQTIEAGLIVDEAVDRLALAREERESGDPVSEAEPVLALARIILVVEGGDQPDRIGALLKATLLETDHRPCLAARIDLSSEGHTSELQ